MALASATTCPSHGCGIWWSVPFISNMSPPGGVLAELGLVAAGAGDERFASSGRSRPFEYEP